MGDELSAAEVDQLARLYASEEPARAVLEECGMPREVVFGIPHSGDARAFWATAAARLADGVMIAGRRRLLEVVRRRYPGSPLFGERRQETGRTFRADRDMVVIERAEGPVTVYAQPSGAERERAEKPATSIFFLGASPFDIDLDRLRADREFRAVQRAERPGVLRVVSRIAATIADLADVLEEKPDVLHLCCHAVDGLLQFEDPDGDPHPIPAAALAQRLRAYRDHADFTLSGLVISACRSAEFAGLFDGLAKTVVAWNNDLDDDCAIAFSAAMYRHLSQSSVRSLGAAARVAVEEVGTTDGECRNLPEQLYVRSM
ncbi:CHAT domain-containing protein [Lentzea albidocapillata subsp. violacea]|uniref:CHAT domain-containing protein n=1 Tax=Lentzea albidocapillata subsp. violacea TaxID=128104 RepID=A0A1G9QZA7_9PSEU|nr:effector-associated domain EAD1-containing protein [Lentzea albidocapillata]SDM16211.1 CHAT domain-containing protein [Lentzea albidocapillata subsp. violacea]